MIIYEKFYKILPKFYRRKVKKLLEYCEFRVDVVDFLGFISFLAFSLFIITFLLTFRINLLFSFLVSLSIAVLTHIAFYFWLLSQASSRAKFVERILPDALLLIASNIRAGLTPDEALIASTREEFGPLAKGFRKASEKLITGSSTEEALKEIPKVVRSRVLDSTIDLIIDGIRSGGEMATLLESIADDLRNVELLKKEIRAIVRMYVIFIFLAGCIASPLIYSLVSYLLGTLAARWAAVPTTEIYRVPQLTGSLGGAEIRGGGFGLAPRIDINLITNFFLMNLLVTNFFAGLIISLIETGSEKEGYKYVPITLSISLALFFLFRTVLISFLSSII